MNAEITLAALVFVPVILVLLLRVNAALVFLSLCLGDVLVQFVAGDANLLLSNVTARATPNNVKLLLLLLPMVLTLLFMVRTVKKSSLVLNVLPALGSGLLLALLVVPLLSPGLSESITHAAAWQEMQKAQDMIVGAGALVSLFFLWLQRPKHHDDKQHKKH